MTCTLRPAAGESSPPIGLSARYGQLSTLSFKIRHRLGQGARLLSMELRRPLPLAELLVKQAPPENKAIVLIIAIVRNG